MKKNKTLQSYAKLGNFIYEKRSNDKQLIKLYDNFEKQLERLCARIINLNEQNEKLLNWFWGNNNEKY